MANRALAVGDSVVVKPGVTDVDLGGDLGGWQGRIAQIHPADPPTVDIEWDSITLRNMPPSIIEHCEEQGLDWSEMCLYADEVALAEARDTEDDVAAAKAELEATYAWVGLGGEQGKRIQRVVQSAAGRDELAVFRAWHKHLEANLTFPFRATVSEYQRGPVRQGDPVTVTGLVMLDDSYGTIVAVTHKRGVYELPLSDLQVAERASVNHQLVDDYAVWFANR